MSDTPINPFDPAEEIPAVAWFESRDLSAMKDRADLPADVRVECERAAMVIESLGRMLNSVTSKWKAEVVTTDHLYQVIQSLVFQAGGDVYIPDATMLSAELTDELKVELIAISRMETVFRSVTKPGRRFSLTMDQMAAWHDRREQLIDAGVTVDPAQVAKLQEVARARGAELDADGSEFWRSTTDEPGRVITLADMTEIQKNIYGSGDGSVPPPPVVGPPFVRPPEPWQVMPAAGNLGPPVTDEEVDAAIVEDFVTDPPTGVIVDLMGELEKSVTEAKTSRDRYLEQRQRATGVPLGIDPDDADTERQTDRDARGPEVDDGTEEAMSLLGAYPCGSCGKERCDAPDATCLECLAEADELDGGDDV